MLRKTTAATLALLMLLSVYGCSKENDTPETDSLGNTLDTQIDNDNGKIKVLTEVFRGAALQLPDEYNLNYGTYVSNEDGNISFVASKYVEERDEKGEFIDSKTVYKVLKYDTELGLISDNDVELKTNSENGNVDFPTIVGNTVYYLIAEYDSSIYTHTYSLGKYDIATGETVYSQDITDYFEYAEEAGFLSIDNLFVDGSGNIYLISLNEVLVLNSDFIKQFSVSVPNWINSASMSADKELYITSYFDNGSGIAKLNLSKRGLDDPIYPGDSISEVYFGKGYDFYAKTSDGLYGYTANEDGSVSGELLMNFQNSDIQKSNLDISTILDKDSFIARYGGEVKLYTKVDDIDLSNITTIEIASVLGYSDYSLTKSIINYNSQHTDSRIILVDFSEYDTSENNYMGGYEKLMNDMLNGLYSPDIILVSSSGDYVDGIVNNELYTDLYSYIDADSDFGRDDIFDSVFREFSYDGKMWGITNQFLIETLVGKTSVVGDRTSWSCDEFIDFALSLDDGKLTMSGLTQSNAATQIDGLFERFFDFENNTCNFETEDFYKTLEFISSLPEEYDYSKYRDNDNRYKYYQDDTISLYNLTLYMPSDLNVLKATFNNEETSLVGYPTADESKVGGKIRYEMAFIITNCCENKDTAWDFIKSAVYAPENILRHNGFSIFKDTARIQCEEDKEMEYTYYFSGGASGHTYDPENPTTEDDLRSPGVICLFSDEDAEKLLSYINDNCGSPIGESVPSDVISIINEEISSFTSGAKSAEECAKVIQSRVSIYLAEHE